MSERMYAYVGNWNFNLVDGKYDRGISCYRYDPENGSLELIEVYDREVAAGQMYLDNERALLFVAYEVCSRRGEIGGGGYLRAYRINREDGTLTLLNEIESLCAAPSYVWPTEDGKHILACHCADPFHANKLRKNPDGTWGNEVVMDDSALILVRVNEDGSLGQIADAYITPSNGKLVEDSRILVDPITNHIQLTRVISRQHAVIGSPSGKLFAVMDKGMDRIHMFKVDSENEKIVLVDSYQDDWGVFPRYGVFHPTLPILYSNNERACVIHAFHYDEETGKLTFLQEEEALLPEFKGKEYSVKCRPMGAQDIAIHPNGKTLYCTVEGGDNLITVFSVDEKGSLKLIQNIDCGGVMPRGVCISPDARFLLCGNNTSGDVTTFMIAEDGTLTATGNVFPSVSPSVIKIAVFE